MVFHESTGSSPDLTSEGAHESEGPSSDLSELKDVVAGNAAEPSTDGDEVSLSDVNVPEDKPGGVFGKRRAGYRSELEGGGKYTR